MGAHIFYSSSRKEEDASHPALRGKNTEAFLKENYECLYKR
jgi:hypothetical protein